MSNEEQKLLNVKLSDVLSMLKNGKTREEISSHYGLTLAEAKKWIFSHPKLKNKKTHKAPKVVLEDDTIDVIDLIDDTNQQESELASRDLSAEMIKEETVDIVNTEALITDETVEKVNESIISADATSPGTW